MSILFFLFIQQPKGYAKKTIKQPIQAIKPIRPINKMAYSESSESIKTETIQKLKEHLALSTINHEKEIMKEITLKNAHIYCVVNNVSAQKYGPLIEKYIRIKNNFVKNTASNCNGDCSKDNKNIEIKASLGGSKHNKFNWVQLRVSHDIDYYILTAYYLSSKNVDIGGDLYVFNVPKEDMLNLIAKYGGYAHGTNKEHGIITLDNLKDEKNKKEYALRPLYGDKCWMDIIKYKVNYETL